MADASPGSDQWLATVAESIIDPERPIVDPHHHLWDRPSSTYVLENLLADTGSGHKVIKTVFLECGASYHKDGPEHLKPIGETIFVESIASASHMTEGAEIAGIVSRERSAEFPAGRSARCPRGSRQGIISGHPSFRRQRSSSRSAFDTRSSPQRSLWFRRVPTRCRSARRTRLQLRHMALSPPESRFSRPGPSGAEYNDDSGSFWHAARRRTLCRPSRGNLCAVARRHGCHRGVSECRCQAWRPCHAR